MGLSNNKRDLIGGGLIVCLGIFIAGAGSTYTIGTAAEMGPGYFPVLLGTLLCLTGAIITLGSFVGSGSEQEDIMPARPDWRGWGCILAGLLSFILLGKFFGLLPAIFGCVFISALGDRSATLRASIGLAGGLTVFGVILFDYFFQIPFPALRF